MVAARLGHADPAVALRVYTDVLREQTASVGDIFAQAVKPLLESPLAWEIPRTYSLPRRRLDKRCAHRADGAPGSVWSRFRMLKGL